MLASFKVGGLFRFHRGIRYGTVGVVLGYGLALSAHFVDKRKFPLLVSSCEGSVGDPTGTRKIVKGMPVGNYSYEGETLDGKMHGQGKLTSPDGLVIMGTFKRGVLDRRSWKAHLASGKWIVGMSCDFPWLYDTCTITLPGYYEFIGTISTTLFRGTKTYVHGNVKSESGPFVEYVSFWGHQLLLHGEDTRYYRDGTVESGRFILGVLHTDKFDSEAGIAMRLLEKALMRIVLWDWD